MVLIVVKLVRGKWLILKLQLYIGVPFNEMMKFIELYEIQQKVFHFSLPLIIFSYFSVFKKFVKNFVFSLLHIKLLSTAVVSSVGTLLEWYQLNPWSQTRMFWICYHHVVPLARISMTLSRHFSLSFIASSELHLVSSHNCCMWFECGSWLSFDGCFYSHL